MKVIASSLRKGNIVDMDGRLYAVVGSQLKVVDQSTGVLTDTSAWLGVASGPSGDEELAHVTAATFDPATGNLFGVESRGSQPSLLFKIDAATGGVIHGGFGTGFGSSGPRHRGL